MSSLLPPSIRELWQRLRFWRREPGRERVPMRALASPLRADLVVQRDFLRLCLEQLERGGACDESLTGVARSTLYWDWWSEVYLPRSAPELARDPVARGRAFAVRVHESFELCRALRERGELPRIVLYAMRDSAAYHAGEDAHAIALVWASGQDALEPGQFSVRRERAFAPLDATSRLREALRAEPERATELESLLLRNAIAAPE